MSQISADLFNYALSDKLAASDNYNAAIGAGLGVGALGFAPMVPLGITGYRGYRAGKLAQQLAESPANEALVSKLNKLGERVANSKMTEISGKILQSKGGRIAALGVAPVLGLAGLGYATYKAGQKSEHNKPFYQKLF